MGFFIILSIDKNRVIAIVEFQPLGPHILGRNHKDLLISKGEKVRTLPHLSVSVAALVQNRHILPSLQILRTVQQYLPASILCPASHYQVISILLFPDLGIPKILQAASLRGGLPCDHGILLVFYIINTISLCHALHLPVIMESIIQIPVHDSCINQHMLSIHLDGASRITSPLIIGFIRSHRGGKILPPDQIFARTMPPMHGPPFLTKWVILEKQMVLTLEYRKSIGIIDPACGGWHMKNRPFFLWNIVDLHLLHSPDL